MGSCEEGDIEGYPDLELDHMDQFIGDIVENLQVDVVRVMENLGRLAELEDEDEPEQGGQQVGQLQQEAQEEHGAQRSPMFRGKKGRRSTCSPSSSCGARELSGAENRPEEQAVGGGKDLLPQQGCTQASYIHTPEQSSGV